MRVPVHAHRARARVQPRAVAGRRTAARPMKSLETPRGVLVVEQRSQRDAAARRAVAVEQRVRCCARSAARPADRAARRAAAQRLQQAALRRAGAPALERREQRRRRACDRVDEQRRRVGLDADAAPGAVGAGALPAVEREQPRVERREADAARGRRRGARSRAARPSTDCTTTDAAAEAQRARRARRRAPRSAGAEVAADDEVDVVLVVAVEQAGVGERDALAVDARLARAGACARPAAPPCG